jgi:phage terminase large subunit-like protein
MMARYINAEKMPNDCFWEGLTDKEKTKVLQWLLQSPTADVVEVGRCGECKFTDDSSVYGLVCICERGGMQGTIVSKRDYCSCGERRIKL